MSKNFLLLEHVEENILSQGVSSDLHDLPFDFTIATKFIFEFACLWLVVSPTAEHCFISVLFSSFSVEVGT